MPSNHPTPEPLPTVGNEIRLSGLPWKGSASRRFIIRATTISPHPDAARLTAGDAVEGAELKCGRQAHRG